MSLYKAILFFIVLALFAAEKPKKVEPKLSKEDQEETRWACGRNHNDPHRCKCAKMVQEFNDNVIDQCESQASDNKAYIECQKNLHKEYCEVIQKTDTKHPEHSCSRYCRKDRSACMCGNDEPTCFGPQIVMHENDDIGFEFRRFRLY